MSSFSIVWRHLYRLAKHFGGGTTRALVGTFQRLAEVGQDANDKTFALCTDSGQALLVDTRTHRLVRAVREIFTRCLGFLGSILSCSSQRVFNIVWAYSSLGRDLEVKDIF